MKMGTNRKYYATEQGETGMLTFDLQSSAQHLRKIYRKCQSLYPEQLNEFRVTGMSWQLDGFLSKHTHFDAVDLRVKGVD